MATQNYWLEHAWLGRAVGVAHGVSVVVSDGRFTSVTPNTFAGQPGVETLSGLTFPGFANAHSHAFHRALRCRTHLEGGTFWTWRDVMYAVAARLDPESYFDLACGVFGEMAMAGIACVGEFHYVHHAPNGVPYANPNAMGEALVAAAKSAGIRITLLDTLYLQGGLSPTGEPMPLSPLQQRFCDGSIDAWKQRSRAVAAASHMHLGHAVHSVRGVAFDDLCRVGAQEFPGVMHAHVSEQPAENVACRAAYGRTPIQLLSDAGLINQRFTAVHATYLSDADVGVLGVANGYCCMCPTTERDLADGIGRARDLHQVGSPLTLGTDSHTSIDMIEEAKLVEYHERLATGGRGVLSPEILLAAATENGHHCLGWSDAGSIAPGQRADLVTMSLSSARLAGSPHNALAAAALYGSNASDITDVIVDGRRVVCDRAHTSIDVPATLDRAITKLVTP